MIPKPHSLSAVAFAIVSLPICGIAPAGTEPSLPPPAFSEPPLEDTGWWFDSTLHTWLAGIDGDIGFRGLTADVNADIGDVLENLDFAYMTHLEFGRNRWGIGLDGVYAKLSGDARFHAGPVDGSASMEIEQAFVTARIQYRLVDKPDYTLDVFGGARWSFLDVDTDIRASFSFDRPALREFNRSGSRRFDFSEDWIDPIVGFRSIVSLDDAWYLQVAGDIGGFGASSDLTWQAVGALGYRLSPGVSVLAGYRALGVDYSEGPFRMDTVNHGPVLALGLRF